MEEAIDLFTCTEIARGLKWKDDTTEHIREVFLREKINKQFIETQAPRNTVKFGTTEVIPPRNLKYEQMKRECEPSIRVTMPRPILKMRTKRAGTSEKLGPAIPSTEQNSHREKLVELFCRCYALCNLPLSQFKRDNPYESLERLSEGIKKAFKVKDECYKYAKAVQMSRHSNMLQASEVGKETKQEASDPQLVERLQEAKWENAELTMTNAELSAKVEQLTAANAKQEIQLTEMAARQQTERRSLEQLNSEHEALTEWCVAFFTRFKELEEQAQSLQTVRDDNAIKIDTLTRQVLRSAKLESQLESLRRSHDQTTRKLRRRESEIEKARASVQQMRASLQHGGGGRKLLCSLANTNTKTLV